MQQIQTQIGRRPSYTGGTLLTLLILQKADLTGVDLPDICLWLADLQHTRLAGGGERGDLRLYPLDERLPVVHLRGHTNTIRTLCFSPDATVLTSAGYDHTIKIWQLETGQLKRTIALPSSVLSLAYSPDGPYWHPVKPAEISDSEMQSPASF